MKDDDDVEEMLLNDTNSELDIEQVNNHHTKIKILSLIQIVHYSNNRGRKKHLCIKRTLVQFIKNVKVVN